MCCALAAFKGIHQCIYNKTAASWGMGGPPPFSPSLFSKKKAIRHLRHHYDYICDDVMFRLLCNNIPMDFFLKETRLDMCGPAYRPQQEIENNYNAWMQLLC